MDKNLHLSNLKKNMKNFETKEDIINIKKDKILSLRKKKKKKKLNIKYMNLMSLKFLVQEKNI